MSEPVENCQHYRIDNATWQCEACSEQMVECSQETQTVLSAPNATGGLCANGPDCDGSPGCTAVYVADMSRARTVPVAVKITYQCRRCRNDGNTFTQGEAPVWDCGHSHQGETIPLRGNARA